MARECSICTHSRRAEIDQVDALSGAHATLVELWKLLAAGDEGGVVTYGEEVNISPV